MALVTYLIGYCGGGPAILVDFDSSSLPAVNGNYYLNYPIQPLLTNNIKPLSHDTVDNTTNNLYFPNTILI